MIWGLWMQPSGEDMQICTSSMLKILGSGNSGVGVQRTERFSIWFWVLGPGLYIYVDGPDLFSVQNLNSLVHEFQDIQPVVENHASP